VVGISANVRFSQQAFADFIKLNYPLLSDAPDLKTIAAYGVLNPERRVAQRSWFIVDRQGIVRYKKVVGPKDPWPSNDELVELLKKLN
jgi:peroxiredoxin